jgi:precorrin-2 methylase
MLNKKAGKLVCVGTGMRMAGQLTPLAKSYIESFDVVIAAVPNMFTRKWLQGVAKEYVCLLDHYDDTKVDGKTRRDTYRRMADTILHEVRQGKKYARHFMGIPVFSPASHTWQLLMRGRRVLKRIWSRGFPRWIVWSPIWESTRVLLVCNRWKPPNS